MIRNGYALWSTRSCEVCGGTGRIYAKTYQRICNGCNGQSSQVWTGSKWGSPKDAGSRFIALATMPVNRKIEKY